MRAESDLDVLLSRMEPVLDATEYVFCGVEENRFGDIAIKPICIFRELEGVTAILRREDAERCALSFSFSCRMITLNIHSSLEAVGFLAKIATKLAEHGISVNVVSAYYHDHLFVLLDQAELALRLLQDLQRTTQRRASE